MKVSLLKILANAQNHQYLVSGKIPDKRYFIQGIREFLSVILDFTNSGIIIFYKNMVLTLSKFNIHYWNDHIL